MPEELNLFDVPEVEPDQAPLHVMAVNETWLQYVLGAIETILTRSSIWNGTESEIGTVLNQVDTLLYELAKGYKPVQVGDIGMSVNSTLQDNRLWCDGTQYTRADYPDLYNALDPVFHVDANNFVVPDLRERVPIGSSAQYAVGSIGGEAAHQLTIAELPTHTHDFRMRFQATAWGASFPMTGNNTGSQVDSSLVVQPTGGNQPHNNMQPYIVCRFWIQAR